jgi:hypothetical protein
VLKSLNKILATQVQQHIRKCYLWWTSEIYPRNVRVVQHKKIIQVMHHINRTKKTMHSSQLMQKWHLTKSITLSLKSNKNTKPLRKLGTEGTFLNMTKSIYIKPISYIRVYSRNWKLLLRWKIRMSSLNCSTWYYSFLPELLTKRNKIHPTWRDTSICKWICSYIVKKNSKESTSTRANQWIQLSCRVQDKHTKICCF